MKYSLPTKRTKRKDSSKICWEIRLAKVATLLSKILICNQTVPGNWNQVRCNKVSELKKVETLMLSLREEAIKKTVMKTSKAGLHKVRAPKPSLWEEVWKKTEIKTPKVEPLVKLLNRGERKNQQTRVSWKVKKVEERKAIEVLIIALRKTINLT